MQESESSGEYDPIETVCELSGLTYNRHLPHSPYVEWNEKEGEWVQSW